MKKKLLFLIPLFLILTHCKKDDDDPEYVIREYSDQVNVDHQLIEDYLRTHTFNYDDFNILGSSPEILVRLRKGEVTILSLIHI